MPRVYTKKKSTRGKEYRCTDCSEPIVAGQQYHEWSRRFGRSGQTYRKHAEHGRPRPTQLSSRKTAVLEEAVAAADFTLDFDISDEELDALSEGGTIEVPTDSLKDTLAEIAECAREIGAEYQESFDNMPEGLNQGSTAQAMEEVASELESWADDLESIDLDAEIEITKFSVSEALDNEDLEGTPEEEEEAREVWRENIREEISSKLDELSSEAESQASEYPEYQG